MTATPGPASSLPALRRAAKECRACDLWERATQTVFGEGKAHAPLMLVGEQPGNDEDLAGRPFVGPAGKLLDRALAEAGIDRAETYVTNVVKHFSWEPRGKWRIHKKPNEREIADFRMDNVPGRLRTHGDLWKPMLAERGRARLPASP